MNIADLLAHVRAVGEAGGTLTLEYDAGLITLTGNDLVQAAEDAADDEAADMFTIADNER